MYLEVKVIQFAIIDMHLLYSRHLKNIKTSSLHSGKYLNTKNMVWIINVENKHRIQQTFQDFML